MVIETIGGFKVPIAVAFAAIVSTFGLHQWAEVNFVTTAQAEQSLTSLSIKIDENGTLLRTHISEYKLGAITRDIQTVRDQQYDLSVMVEQSGVSALSTKRETELKNRLTDLEKKERCVLEGKVYCP